MKNRILNIITTTSLIAAAVLMVFSFQRSWFVLFAIAMWLAVHLFCIRAALRMKR